jgi:hypothetical protein
MTSDVSELQRKVTLINKYLSIMVSEKIELLKTLDRKLKQEIDKTLEDYER